MCSANILNFTKYKLSILFVRWMHVVSNLETFHLISVYVFIYKSIYLSIYLFIYLSICLIFFIFQSNLTRFKSFFKWMSNVSFNFQIFDKRDLKSTFCIHIFQFPERKVNITQPYRFSDRCLKKPNINPVCCKLFDQRLKRTFVLFIPLKKN